MERLTEDEPGVLDRVMSVHVEVAVSFEREVEAAMTGDQLQHVVEEPDAGADAIPSASVDFKADAHVCFPRPAINGRGTQARPPRRPAPHECDRRPLP